MGIFPPPPSPLRKKINNKTTTRKRAYHRSVLSCYRNFQSLFSCITSASCKAPDSLTNQIGNSLILDICLAFKLTTSKDKAHTTLLCVYSNTGRKKKNVQKGYVLLKAEQYTVWHSSSAECPHKLQVPMYAEDPQHKFILSHIYPKLFRNLPANLGCR